MSAAPRCQSFFCRHLTTSAMMLAALVALGVPVAATAEDGLEASPTLAALDAIEAVLDSFHLAASEADEERYLGHLASQAVFLGTDARERWTREAFREFVHPYFSRGQGWTYEPVERHITLSADSSVAWFDEHLENSSYGTCRGTGVLQLINGAWLIEQYNLTIPVPNELSHDLVGRIRELEDKDPR